MHSQVFFQRYIYLFTSYHEMPKPRLDTQQEKSLGAYVFCKNHKKLTKNEFSAGFRVKILTTYEKYGQI